MKKILERLQEKKNWKEFTKKSCRTNKIPVQIANHFTPNKIRAVYERLLKLYQNKNISNSTCWFQNQLKAFHWFLVVVSGLKQILVENFNQEEWKMMCQIFLNKESSIMQYEAIKLVNESLHKNRSWNKEETQLLTNIINQNQNNNKWNDIARKLFQYSKQKFFRSGKQCRERWLNHLDPSKKRGEWEDQEDRIIVKYILFNGRKWSNISKELLNQRTEHMVKNRYKTLIIKQKKLTPKISNENTLILQIGKRLLGQACMPQKNLTIFNQQMILQSEEQKSVSEQEKEIDDKTNIKEHKKKCENITLKKQQIEIQQNKKKEKNSSVNEEKNTLKDPIISQVIEECTKGITSVSNSLSNYELQQVYSPFYINYQGLTPHFSFFMNSYSSLYGNFFNQSLFMRSISQSYFDKKQETSQ